MTFDRILLPTVLLALAVWTGLQFLGVGAGGSFEFWGIGRAMGAIEILLVVSLILNTPRLRAASPVTVVVLWWIPWVFLNVAISVDGDFAEWLMSGALPSLLWPLAYLFFYVQARRNPNVVRLLERYFLLLSGACVALFFSVFDAVNAGRTSGLQQLNAVYYPLLTLPWVVMVRKPMWRLGGTSLIVLAVFFSLKRTAIVALLLAGLAYVVIELLNGTRASRRRWILPLAVLLAISGAGYLRVDESLEEAFSERLKATGEDGGSGRVPIYIGVLEALQTAPAENLVFGHGHYSTFERFGITAHNDFLEVTYDYGLVGLALYFALHWCLARGSYGLIRIRSEYASAFAVSYAVFFVMSMTSHLIIYPTYFVFLVAFWGTVEGLARHHATEALSARGDGAVPPNPTTRAPLRNRVALQ